MKLNVSQTGKYDEIIDLSHHVSAARRAAIINRTAQFLPFAVLTGYHAAIKKTDRLTERRIELFVEHDQSERSFRP